MSRESRKLHRVQLSMRAMMVLVMAIAVLLAWSYHWSGRTERCYELASRHAALSAAYAHNGRGTPMMLRIAAWHDHMRQRYEDAALRPWDQIPKSLPFPPRNW
jgi:hypothetical protein